MSRCLISTSLLLAFVLVVGCGGDKRDSNPPSPLAETGLPVREVSETHPPAGPPELIGVYKDAEKRVVTWLESNPGDYNRDGEVSGQDIFPLAVHFGEHSNFNGFIEDTPLNNCIDGNRDGTLTGLDLFTISVNFGSQVTGFNLYKSTNDGADWTLVDGSPFPREDPASFLCHYRGRYDDTDGWFDPAWYYVTSLGGEEAKAPGETAPSETVTEAEEAVVSMDQDLTGDRQNVIDGLCFGVRLEDAIAGNGDSVTLGFVNNFSELEGVPALGQAFYTDFTTGGLGGDFIVRMPFLPRDIFSLELDDIGLMYFQPETKAPGSWIPVDPADFNLVQTGDDEGFIEYQTDLPYVMLGLFNSGLLNASIHGMNTTGDAPLSSRFSCAARGGDFPYTYIWMIDGAPDQTGSSHRYSPTFNTPGTYEVTCEVEDSNSDTVLTDPINVRVTGIPPDVTPPAWDTTTGAQEAAPFDQQVTIFWNNATDVQSPPVKYNLYYDTQTPVRIGAGAVEVLDVGEVSGDPRYDWVHRQLGLVNGQQYWFVVRTEDSAAPPNEDLNSIEISETPTDGAGDTTPPEWSTLVGILRADRGNGQVHCEWSDAFEADSPPIKWNIYYDTQSPIRFDSGAVKLADVPAEGGDWWTWGYDVTGLTNGTQYWFAVRAEDSAVPANEDPNTIERSATPSESIFDWIIEFADPGSDVGRHTSISFDYANPHISYYDVTNQDLKMTWRDEMTGLWSDEIVDSTDNVGRFTSIKYNGANGIEISYQDASEDTLKRAVGIPGSWTIDTPWATQEIGEYSSILTNWDGNTWISHQNWEAEDLLFSHFDGTSWTNETVLDTGANGAWSSIVRNDYDGLINVSCYQAGAVNDLLVATLDGAAWSVVTVDSTGDVGSHSACSSSYDLGVTVSYYDATGGDLKVALSPGGVWNTQTVDSIGDVGQYSSCKTDFFGGYTVAYYDVTNGDLKIAFWDGADWTIEIVDSEGDVGRFTDVDIAVEPGTIGISYYDVTNGRLKYAQSNNPLSMF